MAAFSTKGVTFWIENKTATPPTAISTTGISNAKPAVVTVAAGDITKVKVGDTVRVTGTNASELDNKVFSVGNVLTTTFTLVGSDTSAHVGAITTGSINNLATVLVEFCLSSFERTQPPAQAITVGTTCDPTAQIAGDPQNGTLALASFVDYARPGFLEFMKAVDDGMPRTLEIRLPTSAVASGNGRIIYPSVTASGFTENITVGAAVAWTGEAVVGEKPIYNVT